MKKLIILLLFVPILGFGQKNIIEVDYVISADKSVSFNYKKNHPGSYFLILEFNSLNNTSLDIEINYITPKFYINGDIKELKNREKFEVDYNEDVLFKEMRRKRNKKK
tara:strand:+ start:960 stop:1283 length:324 start_codon:yes stop_codon:yes gene_type:complete